MFPRFVMPRSLNGFSHVLAFPLLLAAGTLSAAEPAGYLEKAKEVSASVVERFELPDSKLYAEEEGRAEPDMMWGNGVMFSALVGAARHDAGYRRRMHDFFEAMDAYWDDEVKIPGYEPTRTKGGNDKYYDDNAWMVLTFLEAWHLTGRSGYRRRAAEALEFVLSGWDDEMGGGIWWHEGHKDESKNTCANAPAALGCFRLARTEKGRKQAELDAWGDRIVVWTVETLQDRDGLFSDAIKVPSGRINHGKLTYNSALMLRCFLALHTRTGKAFYLNEARRIADASEVLRNRDTGAYRDHAKWSHLMVEAELELYRRTGEEKFLDRARATVDEHYRRWKRKPSGVLITEASLMRELWLMADLETEHGRAFWEKLDGKPASPSGVRDDR